MKQTRTHIGSHGFHGVLYRADDSKSVVITLSGSDGGLKMARDIAKFYCKNGVSALALGYFKTKETSRSLSSIPMEYIEMAIAWLKARGYRNIGIDGISKGSEYALVAAAMFSDISCVVARAPSHFVSEGLSAEKQPSGTSCWSYQNLQLPYTPYKIRRIDVAGEWKAQGEFHLLRFNSGKSVTDDSVIPVENIRAPILLISTQRDTVWPSAQSGECIEDRLESHRYMYPYRHVCYHYVSHFLTPAAGIFARILFKSEREYRKECVRERQDMNLSVLNWVRKAWNV